MNKRIVIFIGAIIGISLAIASVAFFLKSSDLNSQLAQTKQVINNMQDEMKRLQEEKEKATVENERLQADAVSYVAINTKLQTEKDNFQKSTDEARKTIENKEEGLQKQKLILERLEKKIANEAKGKKVQSIKERESLHRKIGILENGIKNERALYHYNLGVAYVKAKFYDEAIDAYEKSLTFGPNNPDAHYNLGLLYGNVKDDRDKAVLHYQKYLELEPDADDKEEVEGWINKLGTATSF